MLVKKDKITQTIGQERALHIDRIIDPKDQLFSDPILGLEKSIPEPEVKTTPARRNFTAH